MKLLLNLLSTALVLGSGFVVKEDPIGGLWLLGMAIYAKLQATDWD